ncbi:MAG: phage portal protein [Oscillospiraceae bacterium]|nr:phage portal protein [Oscillospiraceae bacterium]
MSIFDRFRRRSEGGRTNGSSTALLINDASAWDVLVPTGYTPLSKNDVVLRCVHKIADLVSDMTIMLMENGEHGDIRVRNELSRKLDVYPCADMTRKNFIYKLVSDMILYGNSVVIPEYDGSMLKNLRPLRAAAVRVDDTGRRQGYFISYEGRVYEPDEVLHFVLVPDPDKPFRGRGFTPQISDAVKNLAQANATKTGFLKSKWKPSIVISINADTEELQNPDKRRKILGSYADETERGEPWLIPAGELDIKTIQPLTLQDLAIQDSITLDTRSIAAACGIPAFLVGIGDYERNAFNNFVATTVMGFAQIIQQELTKKLLYDPAWYFKFNPKSLLQYSLAEKSAYVTTMVNDGMLSRNEGRAEFDYSPVDADGMNDYALLENYIRVGDVGKQKKLVQDEPTEE